MSREESIIKNENILSLDEIIEYYKKRKLLAHEEVVRLVSERLMDIPVNIPLEDIITGASLLKVWPLVEKYKIFKKSITKNLTIEEKDKLCQLDLKYARLKSSEDVDKISEHLFDKYADIRFMNPFILGKKTLLNYVLSAMCEPLYEHIRGTHLSKTKILHDTQMGGSIYIIGKPLDEKQYAITVSPDDSSSGKALHSFLQRSFICINHKLEPIIFMDSIEGGYPYFKRLEHWRGVPYPGELIGNKDNKIHEVYFALAGIMHIAEKLGIADIVLRDYELVELGRILGIGEKTVFSKEQGHWKIGLHSLKDKTGVYTHSLYRGGITNMEGHQLRHLVLELFPLKNSGHMIGEVERQSSYIVQSNTGRKNLVPKTDERVNALKQLNHIIQEHSLITSGIKEYSNNKLMETLYTINGA